MDLSKLSDADLDAYESGDLSKMSDEGLSTIEGAEAPAEPTPVAGSMSEMMDLVKQGKGFDIPGIKSKYGPAVPPGEDITKAITGAVGATALPAGLAKTAMGRIAGNAAAAGATNASGVEASEKPMAALKGGLAGAAVAAPFEAAGGLARYLMGRSTNAGTQAGGQALDEGLIGTNPMMTRQAKARMGEAEKGIQDTVGGLEGSIESEGIAEEVLGHQKQFSTPSGTVPASVAGPHASIADRAADISSRGAVDPREALALKRIAGREGYAAGEPRSGLEKELARTESSGYGDALKKLSPEMASGLEREAGLYEILEGLKSQGGGDSAGTIKSAIFKSALPIAGSAAAQTMHKTSKALKDPSQILLRNALQSK